MLKKSFKQGRKFAILFRFFPELIVETSTINGCRVEFNCGWYDVKASGENTEALMSVKGMKSVRKGFDPL